MKRWIKTFLNFFLKPNCPLCYRPAETCFCSDCRKQLQDCQFPAGLRWKNDIPVFIWGRYDGALKQAITKLKYHNSPEIAQPLGEQLGEAWLDTAESTLGQLVVVPIPMFAAKQKKRGFNQAELIARSFCKITGLPLKSQGLRRVRNTTAQFSLSSKERQKNLKSAFSLGRDFRQSRIRRSVILVDDIFTSGATVKAAIKTLKRAKIPVAGVVAVATTRQPLSLKKSPIVPNKLKK
ncbi:MAG: ComF family protein [Microcoleaceae cyanobacterium]